MDLLKYQSDTLEQYQRRETIKVTRLSEDKEENLLKKVTELCTAYGVDIKAEDISVVHRSGQKKRGKSRPAVMKFISRRSKGAVMKRRRDLTQKAGFKGVFLNDDLT